MNLQLNMAYNSPSTGDSEDSVTLQADDLILKDGVQIEAIVDELILKDCTPLPLSADSADYEELIQIVNAHPLSSVDLDSPSYADIVEQPQFRTMRELRAFAFDLNEQIQSYNRRPQGLRKLKHRVFQELQSLQSRESASPCASSNIFFLDAVWQVVLNEGDSVTSIFKKFKFMTRSSQKQRGHGPLQAVHDGMTYTEYNSVPRRHLTEDGQFTKSEVTVDVVCDDGARWIKVKACNPHSMEIKLLSGGRGQRSVTEVAESYLECSRQHPLYFKSPRFEMVFTRGITYDIARILHSKGVHVRGHIFREDFLCVPDAEDHGVELEASAEAVAPSVSSGAATPEEVGVDESCVNLGVRCMLTMISALANGETNALFFDELQKLVYGKQVDLVNDIMRKQTDKKQGSPSPSPPAAASSGPSPSAKVPQPEVAAIGSDQVQPQKAAADGERAVTAKAFEFKYCDRELPRQRMVAANGNPVTATGFTLGRSAKLKLTERMKNKVFIDKSYEEHKMLLQSYMDEAENPTFGQILPCLEGKQLVCCESAWNHFIDIARISAGPNEWARCVALQQRITIVPDQLSPRTLRLKKNSTSEINRAVFGTGDALRILTVSAIASFPRKAEQQGVRYHSVIHNALPLLERYQDEFQRKWKEDHPEVDGKGNEEEDGMVVVQEEEDGNGGMIVVEEEELEEHDLVQMIEAMDQAEVDEAPLSHTDGW